MKLDEQRQRTAALRRVRILAEANAIHGGVVPPLAITAMNPAVKYGVFTKLT